MNLGMLQAALKNSRLFNKAVQEMLFPNMDKFFGRLLQREFYVELQAERLEGYVEDFEKLILSYDLSARKNRRYMVAEDGGQLVCQSGYAYPAMKFNRERIGGVKISRKNKDDGVLRSA